MCQQAVAGALEQKLPDAEWYAPLLALPETQEGDNWVIIVSDGVPAFRKAVVLPLHWIPDTQDAPTLPMRLLPFAERARQQLRSDPAVQRCRWGLHLNECIGGDEAFDLRHLPFQFESAGASLMAGLLLRAYGGVPDRLVWATGAWEENRGVGPVDGLQEKAELARAWQATTLFVPPGQRGEVNVPGLEVLELGREASPWEALREYLLRWDLPTREDDSPEGLRRRKRRHLRLLKAGREDVAGRYYRDDLLPAIIKRSRDWLARQQWGRRPRFLVTIASDNPDLVALAAAVLEPEKCLILYTRDKVRALTDAKGLLQRHAPQVTAVEQAFRNDSGIGEAFTEIVQAKFPEAAAHDLCFDLTPGHKLMSLALAYYTAPPGSWLVYLRHEFYDAKWNVRRVEPFSERFQIWPTGRPWADGMLDRETPAVPLEEETPA